MSNPVDTDLNEVEDCSDRICKGRSAPSKLLNTAYFTRRDTFAFERFLQSFYAVYHSNVDKKDLEALSEFLQRISIQKNVRAERRGLFRLACAALEFNSRIALEPVDDLLALLIRRGGCLEFNPYLRSDAQMITLLSATFPCVLSKYESSVFLPSTLRTNKDRDAFALNFSNLLEQAFGLREFTQKSLFTQDQATHLETVFYELYSNILVHARDQQLAADDPRFGPATFWFLRVELFPSVGVSGFFARMPRGEPFSAYRAVFNNLLAHRRQQQFRVISVTIQDNGPGIARHFIRRVASPDKSDATLLTELSTTHRSSSTFPGSGGGIPQTLDAVRSLHGLLSVRTNTAWSVAHAGSERLYSLPGGNSGYVDLPGTSYTLLLPSFAPWTPDR